MRLDLFRLQALKQSSLCEHALTGDKKWKDGSPSSVLYNMIARLIKCVWKTTLGVTINQESKLSTPHLVLSW